MTTLLVWIIQASYIWDSVYPYKLVNGNGNVTLTQIYLKSKLSFKDGKDSTNYS